MSFPNGKYLPSFFTWTERTSLSMLIESKILFTTVESEESTPNRHELYGPMTQFALPLKMKLNRKDTIVIWALFIHKFNFEQTSSKGIGFCSLYYPHCCDYGIYSEMMKNNPFITFQHVVDISRSPCGFFTLPHFKNLGSTVVVLNIFSSLPISDWPGIYISHNLNSTEPFSLALAYSKEINFNK